jgi:DNA primase
LHLKKKVIQKLLEESKQKIKEADDEKLEVDVISQRIEIYMELKKFQVEIDRQLGIVVSY